MVVTPPVSSNSAVDTLGLGVAAVCDPITRLPVVVTVPPCTRSVPVAAGFAPVSPSSDRPSVIVPASKTPVPPTVKVPSIPPPLEPAVVRLGTRARVMLVALTVPLLKLRVPIPRPATDDATPPPVPRTNSSSSAFTSAPFQLTVPVLVEEPPVPDER